MKRRFRIVSYSELPGAWKSKGSASKTGLRYVEAVVERRCHIGTRPWLMVFSSFWRSDSFVESPRLLELFSQGKVPS